jgi:hypothetical protein
LRASITAINTSLSGRLDAFKASVEFRMYTAIQQDMAALGAGRLDDLDAFGRSIRDDIVGTAGMAFKMPPFEIGANMYNWMDAGSRSPDSLWEGLYSIGNLGNAVGTLERWGMDSGWWKGSDAVPGISAGKTAQLRLLMKRTGVIVAIADFGSEATKAFGPRLIQESGLREELGRYEGLWGRFYDETKPLEAARKQLEDKYKEMGCGN